MFDMLLTSVATVQENSLCVNHLRKHHCFTILHNYYYNKKNLVLHFKQMQDGNFQIYCLHFFYYHYSSNQYCR